MSTTRASATRDRLLDAAESLVNHQGFSGTSVDQIIEHAGVTKGTFFYHFKTKNDLARALLERYAAGDRAILEDNMERAERLSDDPLQQLLNFVGLLLDVAAELDETPNPGCLFATYCYESGIFDEETNNLVTGSMLMWREALGKKLRAAAELHPPRMDVDLDQLADMLTIVFEGAFVMSRSTAGGKVFTEQLRLYRSFLQLLFDTSPSGSP